jgi:hypothetical protein
VGACPTLKKQPENRPNFEKNPVKNPDFFPSSIQFSDVASLAIIPKNDLPLIGDTFVKNCQN